MVYIRITAARRRTHGDTLIVVIDQITARIIAAVWWLLWNLRLGTSAVIVIIVRRNCGGQITVNIKVYTTRTSSCAVPAALALLLLLVRGTGGGAGVTIYDSRPTFRTLLVERPHIDHRYLRRCVFLHVLAHNALLVQIRFVLTAAR